MGVDYYAYSLLGIKVAHAKLFKEDTVRGCSHDINIQDGTKFCPECGMEIWETISVPLDEAARENGEYDNECFGFDLITDYSGDIAYIGNITGNTDAYSPAIITRFYSDKLYVDQIEDRLKSSLDPFGLWDANEFGLWTIMQVSG